MSSDMVQKTAQIVEAFVRNNSITAREIPQFIKEVHASLTGLSQPADPPLAAPSVVAPKVELAPVLVANEVGQPSGKPTPAVAIADSISDAFVTCLICGKPCKTLKGHLTRSHHLELDEYRAMFDLPTSYPVVSPDYSAKRRKLAIDSGLGDKLHKARKK
ncbi:transcriptional regulator, MucR family [Magnetococcus marinus MC-1]|uniref:Transcriptional regulator, MucR family n=1 Tax=Magnetococcus marinus (strain ATCC BAA-1437 / JCM 17883 / MC-1) TaxID=156889 RepID=A0LDQ3_MAGMM|nr:MucR family transcriptional regulator [Magnetococcus marinus]ABK46096.1 transcriptional regulator, MucR family [Magnetococcus marinus MC-1]